MDLDLRSKTRTHSRRMRAMVKLLNLVAAIGAFVRFGRAKDSVLAPDWVSLCLVCDHFVDSQLIRTHFLP